jgi:hypothetical protein
MLPQDTIPARDAVDHLIVGGASLAELIDWFERLTGVRAVEGGSHPGRGTHNALLSLDGRQYVELMAPDPAQRTMTPRPELAALREPRLVGWAAASRDLDALVRRSRDSGLQTSGPLEGARARPDGGMVRWRTAAVSHDFGGPLGAVPFFIQWDAGTRHPSEEYPPAGQLDGVTFVHPAPDALRTLLNQLGIDASVEPSETAGLVATLSTPKGRIVLR